MRAGKAPEINTGRLQSFDQLRFGIELMRVNPKLSCRQNIFLPIVCEEKRVWGKSGGLDRLIKDSSVGLEEADFAGKDQMVEVIQNAIVGPNEVDMRFIRVGNED